MISTESKCYQSLIQMEVFVFKWLLSHTIYIRRAAYIYIWCTELREVVKVLGELTAADR